MDESRAESIAALLGGYAWNSGGGIHLVVIERQDGHKVVISDEVIFEYQNVEAVESGQPLAAIRLV